MVLKDNDFDGIPNKLDGQPDRFNVTPENKGMIVDINAPEFQASIKPLEIEWLNTPTSATGAIAAWTALKINDRAKYDGIKKNMGIALGRTITDKEALAVWKDAVAWTQAPGTMNGKPTAYISLLDPSDYVADEESSRYGTTTQKQTYTTEYSTSQAASDANQTFRSELGREASGKEVSSYQKQVNALAAKQPSVSQGTTTTTPGGSVSNVKQSTGFNPTEFAKEFARSMPDYAESFAARDFLKLIDQTLSDPTRIGQVVQ